jgi:hypothetical protein
MSEARKMSVTPPSIDTQRVREFIEEPEKKLNPGGGGKKHEKITQKYPWEEGKVSPEIVKNFQLRMKQPDKLKAEWIVNHSLEYNSLHDFCMKAVLEKIEAELSHHLP